MTLDRRTFLAGLGALVGGAGFASLARAGSRAGPAPSRAGEAARGAWQRRPLARSGGVIERCEGARSCLVLEAHPGQKACFLNDTGREIWDLVDGRRSCQEITGVLARRHGLRDSAELSAVSGFVAHLVAHQLVVVS